MANTSFLKWAAVQAAGPELARRLVSAMRVERTFPDVKTETIASPVPCNRRMPVADTLELAWRAYREVARR
eukprot:CAMPEP_0184376730 /NCGR_PEP_ID=MMETSP0007-20130409/1700_1 /TAXON_ID=97485 /ORGANISM="Prymnesium parvum, Strain Texoma1" /LENGTH=70 /DNA_ID=CAMNT_0026720375 /DNA_START=652 /DNA_END=860 /DNA_ORIENTATION=+